MSPRVLLVGDPVAQSVSPAMHRAAFAAVDLPWEYEALRVRPGELAGAWAAFAADRHIVGLNVTIPLKEAVVPLLDRSQARAGSVNTVVFAGGTVPRTATGWSTDGEGFLAAVRAVDGRPRRRAVILGTGGAARAVAAALRGVGSDVTVLGRNAEAGRRMAAELGVRFAPWEPTAGVEADRAVGGALQGADLLANATPIGSGDPEASPLGPGVAVDGAVTVIDLVYRPRRTALLRAAEAAGCRTVEGIEMLIEQGARSFERWTALPAPVGAMREAAHAATGGELVR